MATSLSPSFHKQEVLPTLNPPLHGTDRKWHSSLFHVCPRWSPIFGPDVSRRSQEPSLLSFRGVSIRCLEFFLSRTVVYIKRSPWCIRMRESKVCGQKNLLTPEGGRGSYGERWPPHPFPSSVAALLSPPPPFSFSPIGDLVYAPLNIPPPPPFPSWQSRRGRRKSRRGKGKRAFPRFKGEEKERFFPLLGGSLLRTLSWRH